MLNKLKIKNIILVSFVSVCVVSSIFIYYFMLNYFGDMQIQRSKDYGSNSVKLNAKIIEQVFDEKVSHLNDISYKLKNYSIKNDDEIRKMLKEYVDVVNEYNGFYIGTEENEFIDANGWEPSDYQVSTRPWFKSVKKSKDKVAITPYYDIYLNREVIGIAIKSQLSDTECVIGSNIEIEQIVKIVESIEYFDTGFGFIVDDRKKIIAMPRDISIYEKEMIKKVCKAENFPDFKNDQQLFKEEGYTIVNEYIEKYGWNLVLVAKEKEFNSYQEDLLKQVNSIFICVLGVVVLFSFYVSRRISEPIEALIVKVRNISTGNLDSSVFIESDWEIGELSSQLENMRLNILQILEKMEFESKLLTVNHKQIEEYLKNTKQGTAKFISMLSHDIKTPITLIKGYASGLQQNIVSTKEKREKYLDNIIFRADQIEKILTNNLDNIYEINNKLVLKPKEIEIIDFVNTVKSISKSYIEAENRIFNTDIKIDNVNACINVDIVKIQRVMDNLLTNAIKFSQDSSEIKLVMYDRYNKLYVGIKDNGIGMPEDKIKNVFDMFYRADNSKKGYGLGLCVCKSIINGHQGDMFVENKDIGCLVGFYLNIINCK